MIADSLATYTPGVSERRGGTTRYTHSGLKNTGAQSTNAIVATRVYDAHGMVRSTTGSWSGPFGYAGDFGYQEDETGLRLLGHRYYDASTGRFLTRDPIKDGRNWYSYADGDPINGVDPNGLEYEFVAGWGDALTFGLTKIARRYIGEAIGIGDANSHLDYDSHDYHAGEAIGTVHSVAIAGAAGVGKSIGAKEFSHFVPDRLIKKAVKFLKPRNPKLAKAVKKLGKSKWNGNKVAKERHARHDVYRNLKGQSRKTGKMVPGMQQLDRLPRSIGVPGVAGAQGVRSRT